MAKRSAATSGTIELTRLIEFETRVKIMGITAVIPHAWSDKARRQMPGHPERDKVKGDKGVRKPEEEAEGCLYKLSGGRLAFPATGFKAAMVGACRFFDKPSMVEAKQLLFVVGEGPEQLVEITGEKILREDMPRNSNGGTDLRYRYAINNWSAIITIKFIPAIISQESVLSLLDAAGRGGIGDWRPSAPKSMTGTFGTWRVDDKGTAELSAGNGNTKTRRGRK